MRPIWAALLGILLTVTTAPASAEPASVGSAGVDPANPLAGHRMGVYRGNAEPAWPPYVHASGHRKKLLGKIALRPKAKWFGDWIGTGQIGGKVREYIQASTRGDSDVLVQMTVFRMVPWEHEACRRLPTQRERREYRRWIDRFAAATGSAHAAIVLQPDGPFALCAPRRSQLPSRLVAYAAEKLSALPNTSVYIDAGASDWPHDDPQAAATILQRAGVAHARGFALNATHYTSTADNVRHGARIVAELADRGIEDTHFVVNTAQNGRPFLFTDAKGKDPDNAKVCATRRERRCVTLGIPPTTDVDNSRWALPSDVRRLAARHVDAYLWFGRPWLVRQASPFSMKRALGVARTTPY